MNEKIENIPTEKIALIRVGRVSSTLLKSRENLFNNLPTMRLDVEEVEEEEEKEKRKAKITQWSAIKKSDWSTKNTPEHVIMQFN